MKKKNIQQKPRNGGREMRRCETEANFFTSKDTNYQIDNLCNKMDTLCNYVDDMYKAKKEKNYFLGIQNNKIAAFDKETIEKLKEINLFYNKKLKNISIKYENKKNDIIKNFYAKKNEELEKEIAFEIKNRKELRKIVEEIEYKICKCDPKVKNGYSLNSYCPRCIALQNKKKKINFINTKIKTLKEEKEELLNQINKIIGETDTKFNLIVKELEQEKRIRINEFEKKRKNEKEALLYNNKVQLEQHDRLMSSRNVRNQNGMKKIFDDINKI